MTAGTMWTDLRKTLALSAVAWGFGALPAAPGLASDAGPEPTEPARAAAAPIETGSLSGDSELCLAALAGDLEQVGELAATVDRADVEARGLHGRRPLHCAVLGGRADVVAALLDAGADLRATDESGSTPLHVPPPHDDPAIAELLLAHGARLDDRNHAGFTPLWGVAVVGHQNVGGLYLERGVPLEGEDGQKTLRVAIERGHFDFAKLLVNAGVRVDEPTERARGGKSATLLYALAEKGGADAVSFLVEQGAAVDLAPPCCAGATPLLAASRRGRAEVVERLLAAGADVEIVDEAGWTPLLEASRMGHADVVRVLLAGGARVDGRGLESTENTPLLWAAMEGHGDVARTLVDAGAELDEPNRSGVTPLMHAAFRDDVELARLLLERGADTEAENQAGRTPLLFAVFRKHLDVTRLLLEHGARHDVHSRIDGFGRVDPLMLAAGRGLLELTHLLLDHGADPSAPSTVVQLGAATPLEVAAKRGHPEVVELLLSRSPSVDLQQVDRARALAEAAGHGEVVEVLSRSLTSEGESSGGS